MQAKHYVAASFSLSLFLSHSLTDVHSVCTTRFLLAILSLLKMHKKFYFFSSPVLEQREKRDDKGVRERGKALISL